MERSENSQIIADFDNHSGTLAAFIRLKIWSVLLRPQALKISKAIIAASLKKLASILLGLSPLENQKLERNVAFRK